jgi:3-oxoadipate enol-lactonase
MPTVKVDGIDLFYEERGSKTAPAVVLAHSLFFDRRMFEHQLESLSDRYHVVAYDQRGHGRSPCPDDGDYEMDTLASDAAGLIEALDLGPAHFAGNSMGGFLALRLAARRPDLIRSATALGSSAEHEHKAEEFRPLVQALKAHGGRPLIDTLMHIMFGDQTLADPGKAEVCALWRAHMAALPNTIGDAAHAVVERRGVIDEIRRAQRPILAIAGGEDHAYSIALSENMAKAAPDGRCVVVGGAGHSVALEAPEEVNAHLRTHFERADQILTG